MTDFQDVITYSSLDDTMLYSAAEFLDARVDSSNVLIQNFVDALAHETNQLAPGVPTQFIAVYDDSSMKWLSTSRFINFLYTDADSVVEYVDEFNNHWDPVQLINQVSEGIVAVTAATEAIKSCIDASLDKTLAISSQLVNRLTLRFADLSDSAAQYGMLFLDLIKDPGMAAKDKVLSILDFLGIKEAMQISSNIKPPSGFNDITGANVWTAFANEVASQASDAWDAVVKSATKIWNGLKNISTVLFGSFINKVKDAVLTASTIRDASGYSSDNSWNGFADYGTTTKFVVGGIGDPDWRERTIAHIQPVLDKLYTDRYVILDIPAGRMLLWKDADDETAFYCKILYRPVHATIYNNFINKGYNFQTLDGLAVFSDMFNNYQNEYSFNTDETVCYGIKRSKMIINNFLISWAEECSDIPTWELEELVGTQYNANIPYSIPSNPTNLDVARYLTGNDNGVTNVITAQIDDDTEWWQMTEMLEHLFSNNTTYIPYYHAYSVPSGMHWVKTDLELANFATNAFIGVAAVLVVLAIVAMTKKLKLAAFTLSARAGANSWNAVGNTIDYAAMQNAFKLQRRADLINMVLSSLTGAVKNAISSIGAAIKQTVTSGLLTVKSMVTGSSSANFVPDSSDISLDEIKYVITG